ncbi:MAG TPA: periplasmic heavy metal sensor [Nitrospirota bacterium]|nr:periplasmic heavy metal sensor [Nitrospirota bacterium]
MQRMGKAILPVIMLTALIIMPAYSHGAERGQPPDDDGWGPGSGPQREEVRRKIETIRIWRLTEALKLDETTAAKLASIMSSLDQQRTEVRREQREAVRTLRVLLKAPKPDDAKLQVALDKLEACHGTIQALRNKEIAAIRELLTTRQQARYVIFQTDFMQDMRKMIINARGSRPGADGGTARGSQQAPEGRP